MASCSLKNNGFVAFIDLINKEPVRPYVALSSIFEKSFERMVQAAMADLGAMALYFTRPLWSYLKTLSKITSTCLK